MKTIELDRITKNFGRFTAVDQLDLSVPRGCIYGFIGPNGSGKTTTLRMIMNILIPDSGNIFIFGERLNPGNLDRIGYMPEERGLYKRMKVGELLEFFASLKRAGNNKSDVSRWLEKLSLSEWTDKKVETLSKGMAQKVQFIATVVARPELVILDEPFTGLDPVNTEILRVAILELQAAGTTIIFSTHDMNMAEKMCDFIFMIFKGKKVLDGTLSAIQARYAEDTIRVRCLDGRSSLNSLPGVEKINDFGQIQELRITPSADPQQIARMILERTAISSFDIVKPSLHDIFVRIAGADAAEVADA